MIPADLLDKLRQKDPELWGDIYQAGINHCDWPDCLVQGKLQEAIRRRGCGYKVRDLDWATVVVFDALEELGRGEAPTTTEAMLRAYIAALSASH